MRLGFVGVFWGSGYFRGFGVLGLLGLIRVFGV